MSDTTAGVVRCPDGALTGVAGALLLERLATTAADFGPGLCALRAGAPMGELSDHGLVHDRHVGLHTEYIGGEFSRACCFTGDRLDRYRGHHLPPFFTALRTMTKPPFGPGTAPLTSSRLRSRSAWTTSRFSVVTCS